MYLFEKQKKITQERRPNQLNYPHTYEDSRIRETRLMDLFDEVYSILHSKVKSAKK